MKVKPPKQRSGCPEYMTLTEVCAVLGVGAEFVVANASDLGGFKLGNHWRFVADRLPGAVNHGLPIASIGRVSGRPRTAADPGDP